MANFGLRGLDFADPIPRIFGIKEPMYNYKIYKTDKGFKLIQYLNDGSSSVTLEGSIKHFANEIILGYARPDNLKPDIYFYYGVVVTFKPEVSLTKSFTITGGDDCDEFFKLLSIELATKAKKLLPLC